MENFDAVYIDAELGKIGSRIAKPADIYLIGGCAMSFRKLKEATKDIDIVFRSREDYESFCGALFGVQYHIPIPILSEHEKLEAAAMYENKDKFHLDLFVERVCGKMILSGRMAKRAEFYKKYGNLSVYLVAKEDIFLFKGLASEGRKRDLSDMRIIYPNLDWGIILDELSLQHLSKDLISHVFRRFDEFSKIYGLDVPKLGHLVKQEMKGIPRGTALQNDLRLYYSVIRMRSLGKKAETIKTKEDVLRECIQHIRKERPDFIPSYDKDFFKIG